MSQNPILKFATVVYLYGSDGPLGRVTAEKALHLLQMDQADRICSGAKIRALRLKSPDNPEEGHERVSAFRRYSGLGQTSEQGLTYVMREYGSRTYAPPKAHHLFLGVLAGAGARIRKRRERIRFDYM